MSNLESEALSRAVQATRDYSALLDRMENVSDELLLAIESWDPEKVHILIEHRSRLCDQIGRALQLLTVLEPEAEALSASMPEAVRDLETAVERAHEKERGLLDQQSRAENALTSEINKRRPALAQTDERRGRRKTYRGPAQGHGRFLDSKI